MAETTVISVRGLNRESLLADPNFLYVGRAMPRQGWKGSIWGNPFKPGMDVIDGQDVICRIERSDYQDGFPDGWGKGRGLGVINPVEWYDAYVRCRKSLMARLVELRGRKLGCWCCNWEPGPSPVPPTLAPCHAIVLAQLANALEVQP